MNYPEALAYLQSALSFGIKPGLERMIELSRRLGQPEQKLKVFHLAGTNGKGSTSSYLTHILATGGYRVGWFTSPYLERFTERIRIISGSADLMEYDRSGQAGEIGETDFARIMSKIRLTVAGMLAAGYEHPTEFELITAVALLWFAEQNCDYVVLETGLGGQLDATNICTQPEAIIITSLGYDHMDRLGATIAEIAAEKAGIFKAGTPVYAYDPAASYLSEADQAAVRTVLSEKAAELACPLTWIGHDERQDQDPNYIAVKTQSFDLSGQHFYAAGEHYSTGLLGSYQPLHAILAATAARPYLEAESITAGIRSTTWPGRLEIISAAEPFILLDGAHNPQGSMALAETLDQILAGQKVIFLTGVLADKDYRRILSEVLFNRKYRPARIIATEPPNPRSLRADRLAEEINRLDIESESKDSYNIHVRAAAIAAAGEATRQAVELARRSGLPLVAFGSLYLAGAIRSDLRRYSRKH